MQTAVMMPVVVVVLGNRMMPQWMGAVALLVLVPCLLADQTYHVEHKLGIGLMMMMNLASAHMLG
jgi:hypothetical protein